MERFNEESCIIKDIRRLALREEITQRALELMDQIDKPVVLWVNAETDKNYISKHNNNPNQLWITIRANTTEEETERIILSNLYKAVQMRRRYQCKFRAESPMCTDF